MQSIGSRPCEISLAKILSETDDKGIRRRTMHRYMDMKSGMKQLLSLKDLGFRKRMMTLLRREISASANFANLPERVRTHLLCCITAEYREMIP